MPRSSKPPLLNCHTHRVLFVVITGYHTFVKLRGINGHGHFFDFIGLLLKKSSYKNIRTYLNFKLKLYVFFYTIIVYSLTIYILKF